MRARACGRPVRVASRSVKPGGQVQGEQPKRTTSAAGPVEVGDRAAAGAPSRTHQLDTLLADASSAHADGRFDDAIILYRRLLDLAPEHVDSWSRLGVVLGAVGRFEEAAEACRRALALDPLHLAALCNLANALQMQGQLDEALICLDRALSINGAYWPAFLTLSSVLSERGNYDDAIVANRKAIELEPTNADAHEMLGAVLMTQGRVQEAASAFRATLALDPGRPDTHSSLIYALDLDPALTLTEAAAERRRWNERHARPLSIAAPKHTVRPDPDRRLRVGYVTSDLRSHSVGHAMAPILFNHDPAQVEVVVYSGTLWEDELTERFIAAAADWRRTRGMSDAELADRVRADQIDILVDLCGHSPANRLLTFARKPAPVQVTAWGYATSTGLEAMNYFLADRVTVPPDARAHYREEIVELPSILCYAPPVYAPNVAPAPWARNGAITFGSFNRPMKLTSETLDAWARILAARPAARLLLKYDGLHIERNRDRVLAAFVARGVDPRRIELRDGTGHAEHLAAYADVDVVLDPFPMGGGVTAVEGLWMGVPALTLLGERIPGRVGASFLQTLGLEGFVAATVEEYVTRAIALADERHMLATLRGSLRDRLAASPIVDGKAYTRAVEAAYRSVWRAWCADQQIDRRTEDIDSGNHRR